MSSSKPPRVTKAFGVESGPGGWSVVEYEIQNGKIIGKIASEPDLRVFALERLTKDIACFWGLDE